MREILHQHSRRTTHTLKHPPIRGSWQNFLVLWMVIWMILISNYMNVLVLILVFHQCQRGWLLILNGYIIILSMMSNLLTIGEIISNLLFVKWDTCLLINVIIRDDWWRKIEKKITTEPKKRLSYVLQLKSGDQ